MNNFTNKLDKLGLTLWKEIGKAIAINVLMIFVLLIMVYFKIGVAFIGVYAVLILFINYLYFSRYSLLINKINDDRNKEFITLLSYFEIFISNGLSVYSSIKELLNYCSDWTKERIEELLNDIDNDKTVMPYIKFSANYNLLIIESIMISIYQMIDEGENKNKTSQFSYLFASISKEERIRLIEEKKKSFDSLNAFPLIGTALLTIFLTIAIVGLIGDMVNVF